MKAFKVSAILENYINKKDGGLSLRFTTNEVDFEEIRPIHNAKNMFGELEFRPEMASGDVVTIDTDLEPKSKSERLRGVLWRLLEFRLDRKPDSTEFTEFYNKELEKIIEHYKTKLPN